MQVDPEFRYPESEGFINIPVYIVLSIVTFGIWFIVWKYKQFQTLNAWQGEEEHNFGMWLLLSFLTCFYVYGIYYDYKIAKSINVIQETHGLKPNSDLPMISLLVTVFGFGLVTTAIHQNDINKFYN